MAEDSVSFLTYLTDSNKPPEKRPQHEGYETLVGVNFVSLEGT